jgi:hypothetical protein
MQFSKASISRERHFTQAASSNDQHRNDREWIRRLKECLGTFHQDLANNTELGAGILTSNTA